MDDIMSLKIEKKKTLKVWYERWILWNVPSLVPSSCCPVINHILHVSFHSCGSIHWETKHLRRQKRQRTKICSQFLCFTMTFVLFFHLIASISDPRSFFSTRATWEQSQGAKKPQKLLGQCTKSPTQMNLKLINWSSYQMINFTAVDAGVHVFDFPDVHWSPHSWQCYWLKMWARKQGRPSLYKWFQSG